MLYASISYGFDEPPYPLTSMAATVKPFSASKGIWCLQLYQLSGHPWTKTISGPDPSIFARISMSFDFKILKVISVLPSSF